MKHQKILMKTMVGIISVLSLTMSMGCPDKSGTPSGSTTQPPSKEITLQMIFDEAAKGGSADLVSLKDMYSKAVVDAAKADELAGLKDSGDDFFFCKLMKLPAKAETSFVTKDFLGKVTSPSKVVNNDGKDCAGAKKPLDFMVDASRSVQGDDADEADDIINTVVDKGDDVTVAIASDKPRVERMLTAVKNKGAQAQLEKVMKKAAASLSNDVIAWSAANLTDVKVVPAMRSVGLITVEMVINEAAKGPAGANPASIPKLKLFYSVNVADNAAAGVLATTAATVGGAPNDRFHHYLAALADDADTIAIWTDYLTKIKANGRPVDAHYGAAVVAGAGAVTDVLASQGAGGTAADAPFRVQLAKGAGANRDAVIKVMVEQGEQGTVRLATAGSVPLATPIVKEMFDAVLATGDAALLQSTFSRVDAADHAFGATLAWAKTNRAGQFGIGGAPNDVLNAFKAAHTAAPIITPVMVVDLAAAGGDIPTIRFVYDVYVADAAAAGTLAITRGTAANADRFHHHLAALADDADTIAIWADYLTKIKANGRPLDADHGVAVAAGAGAVTDVLANQGVGGTAADAPFRVQLAKGASANRDAVIKVMVEQGEQGTVRLATAGSVPLATPIVKEMFDAVLATGDAALLQSTFSRVDAADHAFEATLAWAKTNRAGQFVIGGAPNDVLNAFKAAHTAAPIITPVMVVDLAAAGGDIPTIRFVYDVYVADAAAAGTLAITRGTAANADRFHHHLAALADDADTIAIWADYLTKIKANGRPLDADHGVAVAAGAGAVTDVLANQGVGGTAADAPFRVQLAKGASANRDAVIKVMVEQGEQGTVRLATAGSVPLATPIVKEMFDAVLATGDAALLQSTFSRVDAADHAFEATLAWAKTNRAGQFVIGGAPNDVLNAFKAAHTAAPIITPVMVVDLAAAGGDIPTIRFVYDVYVADAAAAGTLAITRGTAANADRFHHHLAALADDADTIAIWADYLTKIKANGRPLDADHGVAVAAGAGAVTDVLANQGVGGTAADAPFRVQLAKGASANRDAVIKVMVEQGEQGTVRLATAGSVPLATPIVKEMFDAVLATGDAALLQSTFSRVDAADHAFEATLAWAKTNRAGQFGIGGAPNDVLNAFKAAHTAAPIITPVMVVDLAAAGGDIPTIRFVYDIYVGNSAANAGTLAVTTETVASNDRFHHHLAALADDADTIAIWTDYLTKIKANGRPVDAHYGAAVVAGAGAVTDVLASQGAGGTAADAPFRVQLGKGASANRDAVIKVMVEQGEQDTVRLATHANPATATAITKEMFDAIGGATGDAQLLEDAFTYVDATDANATLGMITWAMNNRTTDIGGSGVANEVLNTMTDSGKVTTAMLLAEVGQMAPNWKKVLFYVQVLAYDQGSAQTVAALNVGGVLLHNLIVAKNQTKASVSALKYFLSFLPHGIGGGVGHWEDVRDNNVGGQTASAILRARGGTTIAGGVGAARDIEALGIFDTDDAGGQQAAPPAANAIANQAP